MRCLFSCLFLITSSAFAQQNITLDYYLPQNISYKESIPTPEEVIGHEVGEWHVTHDKLVQYMQAVAAASDRITIETRGYTFEGRPILLLTITSPENHRNLEEIRTAHLALSDPQGGVVDTQPVIVYQGFSIHGNEASGSNAALAYAYYLAAAEGAEIDSMLADMVILLDPSFNPDGLQRFAYWANTNRSMVLNPDPNEREYHEVWPGGRTNHYWFDMNRDWLPVQLPESRARINTFHRWLPNILTDHHEMGSNSTFFFQPGEPSRVHPLTPSLNQELTREIGTYHARALDKLGSLYYSEENYDDYYYGKGSTFPDVNGSIGILFEQGSSRGHMQETENGLLTFPFTIRNQFTTALSTIEAAYNMRTKLLAFQRDFYRDMRNEAARSKARGFVFGDRYDLSRSWHLAEILKRHQITIHHLNRDVIYEGKTIAKDGGYMVPLDQKNHRLIKAIFEKRTSFTDSLFYDVSAWTLPLAFNVNYHAVNSLEAAGPPIAALNPLEGSITGRSNYAYLLPWYNYYSPKALYKLLEAGLRAKVAKSRFNLENADYDYGTIMIPVQNQPKSPDEIFAILQGIVRTTPVKIIGVNTGLTRGIDLGSNEFDPLKKPKIGLLVGDGIRSYDAGEIWHLMDTRYEIPITKIDMAYLGSADLSKYTDIIIPSAWGSSTFSEPITKKLSSWVQDGGTLIGYRSVANWFNKSELLSVSFKKDTSLVAKNVSFEQRGKYFGAQVTGGAIFEAKIDRSHPVNYGYSNDRLPMFRNSNIYIEADKQSFNNPIQYTSDPLLSGYISEENLELLKNSVPFKVSSKGKGKIILFTDNTNFRAFWYGTNKLLMNAIFFGDMM